MHLMIIEYNIHKNIMISNVLYMNIFIGKCFNDVEQQFISSPRTLKSSDSPQVFEICFKCHEVRLCAAKYFAVKKFSQG